MKKFLSILSLVSILSLTVPAFAVPNGHTGPRGHSPHHGSEYRIHAGAHHRPHIAPKYHGNFVIRAGYPRHSYRYGYLRNTWCDYRLGWCSPYYSFYPPINSASFSIRF